MVENRDTWNRKRLFEIGNFYNGLSGKIKDDFIEGNAQFITYMNVYKNMFANTEMLESVAIREGEKQNIVRYGDLLFTQSSETLEEVGLTSIWLHSAKVYLNSFCFGFRIEDKKILDPRYAGYLFRSNPIRKKVVHEGQGNIRVNLASSRLKNLELCLPPLPEQKKIAEILSTWGEAIDSNERLLRTTKQLKSVYVNKIFMGRLFTNIDSKKAFEKLGKHIVEKTDRNKGDNTNDVLSVSNTKGFVLQSDQFEREIASKDKNNYKIVRKGQFAYNPSRVNVGSIDQLLDRNIGIISPMYVVFECKETIESRYLYHFLKSEYFLRLIPRFTQGSVRDSLSFDGLSNMKIHVPSIDKQVKYSNLLDTIDEKIKVLERKNEYLSKQKQGLMQRLLTGKVRVKLD